MKYICNGEQINLLHLFVESAFRIRFQKSVQKYVYLNTIQINYDIYFIIFLFQCITKTAFVLLMKILYKQSTDFEFVIFNSIGKSALTRPDYLDSGLIYCIFNCLLSSVILFRVFKPFCKSLIVKVFDLLLKIKFLKFSLFASVTKFSVSFSISSFVNCVMAF